MGGTAAARRAKLIGTAADAVAIRIAAVAVAASGHRRRTRASTKPHPARRAAAAATNTTLRNIVKAVATLQRPHRYPRPETARVAAAASATDSASSTRREG